MGNEQHLVLSIIQIVLFSLQLHVVFKMLTNVLVMYVVVCVR